MSEQNDDEFLQRVPEHLRFFFVLPPENLEAEELVAEVRHRVAKAREYREELLARGIPVDRFITQMSAKADDLAAQNKDCDEAQDRLLTAQADLADAEYELFKQMKSAVEKMEEEHRFHPQVQEWREQLDEMSSRFPKE
jgi:hypothetical protein